MNNRTTSEKDDNADFTVSTPYFFRRIYSALLTIYAFFGKNPQKTAFRIGITALFVYLVNKGIKLSEITQLLKAITVFPMAAIFILGVASLFFQLVRWRLILVSHKLPSGIAVTCKTMFRGFLLAFVTPGRLGELFRAMDLDINRKMDTILAVVEERLCAVVIIVVTGIASSAIHYFFYGASLFLPLIIAMTLFCGVAAAIIIIAKGDGFPLRKLPFFNNRPWLPALMQRWKTLPMVNLLLLSISAHLLLILQTAFLLRMFGSVDLIRGMLVAGQAYAFMLLLPFFIANIGLREYSFSLFLMRNSNCVLPITAFNSVSLGAATFILLFNIMIPAAVGMIWIYTGKPPVKSISSNISRSSLARNDTRDN